MPVAGVRRPAAALSSPLNCVELADEPEEEAVDEREPDEEAEPELDADLEVILGDDLRRAGLVDLLRLAVHEQR